MNEVNDFFYLKTITFCIIFFSQLFIYYASTTNVNTEVSRHKFYPKLSIPFLLFIFLFCVYRKSSVLVQYFCTKETSVLHSPNPWVKDFAIDDK